MICFWIFYPSVILTKGIAYSFEIVNQFKVVRNS